MKRKIDYRLFKRFRNSKIKMEVVDAGIVIEGKFVDVLKLMHIAWRRGDIDRTSFEMGGTK